MNRLSVIERQETAVTVMVEVEDTGTGIAPDHLPLLFQPFSQVGKMASRRFSGTRLGLVITKRLIEMMGGSVGVDSELGKGTRFWFTLPLRLAPCHADPATDLIAAPMSAVLRRLRIL